MLSNLPVELQSVLVTVLVGVVTAAGAALVRLLERLGAPKKAEAIESKFGSLYAFARQSVIAAEELAHGDASIESGDKYSFAITAVKDWAGKVGFTLTETEAASLVNSALQEYRAITAAVEAQGQATQ